MLANLLIILIIILVLGILFSRNGSKKVKKAKTVSKQKIITPKNLTQNVTENTLTAPQEEVKVVKKVFKQLSDKEKQVEMKVLGAKAYDKGQSAKFSTLHILDFGSCLTTLGEDISEFKELKNDEQNSINTAVNDLITQAGDKDLICFKSG